MGSYLLLEGNEIEAIEWFNLAKNAKFNINKEFPFINSGRVYLMQKKYKKALEEFKQAFKFVPYQGKIKKTIEQLEDIIEKKDSVSSLSLVEDLPCQ